MDAAKIFEYFRVDNSSRQTQIMNCLQAIETFKHSFCGVYSFQCNSFFYLSTTVENILGYTVGELIPIGFAWFSENTPSQYIPGIIKKQAEYLEVISRSDFNYRKPFLIEMNVALINKAGQEIKLSQTSVALDYDPGGNFRAFLGVWNLSDEFSKEELLKRKLHLEESLREFHWLIFAPGQYSKIAGQNPTIIQLKIPDMGDPTLTGKEKELLGHLAKGLSLKEVAAKQNVSYFTVETHRKNLFAKFNVHNVAELIKKASKVYWFE